MLKTIVIGIISCIALFAGIFSLLLTSRSSTKVSSREVGNSLHLSEVYIQSHLFPDGSVLYDYDSLLHQNIGGTYDAAIVRDDGISLSASLLYGYDHDPAMASVEETFAHKFLSNTASFSSNETGTNAISCIAFSLYDESVPQWQALYKDQLAALLHNIEDRQLPSGAFMTSALDPTVNAYFTGEALLALSYALDDTSNSADQQRLVNDIDNIYTGVNAGVISPSDAKSIYMWLNRSTVLLLQSSHFSATQKQSFVSAAQRVNEETMTDILPLDDSANNCIWGEGIAEYLQFAPPSDETSQLRNQLQGIVADSLSLQAASTTSMGLNIGGFAPEYGAVTARIDYTQHCIGMLLSYEQLLTQKL